MRPGSWKSKLILLAAVVAAAATWTGYRAERREMDAAGKAPETLRSMVKRIVTPSHTRAGVDRLEDLRQAIGRKYPSRVEAAALWEVVRGFSVEDVTAALDGLPKGTQHRVNGEIADMLFYRWAQLEPEAAAAAALASGDDSRRFAFYTILSAWAQRDPEAAIRWGRESDNPMARGAAMQVAARQWVSDDPATALSRAKAEFPDAVPYVLRVLVDKLSRRPESRQQLFSLLAKDLPGHPDGGLFSRLAFDLGRVDPAGVEDLAGEMAAAGISEARIQQFREGSLRYYREANSAQAMEKAAANPDPVKADERRRATYSGWVVNAPEEALEWAVARGETELVSRTIDSIAGGLLASDWSPGREQSHPWEASVRKQFDAWQRLDTQAAAAWLAIMPADIRKLAATPAASLKSDAAR